MKEVHHIYLKKNLIEENFFLKKVYICPVSEKRKFNQ